jgi:hypothetical protein
MPGQQATTAGHRAEMRRPVRRRFTWLAFSSANSAYVLPLPGALFLTLALVFNGRCCVPPHTAVG